MNFITTAKTIISLLPAIIDAVKAIESALPQSGMGAQKLALIRATLQSAYGIAKDVTGTFDQIWPAIESTVGAVVGLFNKIGVFNKQ